MKWLTFFTLSIFILLPFAAFADALHVMTSLDPLEAKEYFQAFQKETGVEIVSTRLSAGEALARLKSEKENPTQTVWFGGPCLDYAAAQKEDLLQAYTSAATLKIPEAFRNARGYWTGIYFGSLAFVSYKPFLEAKKIPAPTSWQDLLKPEVQNEVAVSLPYTSGTGFTLFSGLVSLMGEAKALDYWQTLHRNIRHYTKSGSAPVLEVALGEVGIGIAFSQDVWRKATTRGFPVVVSYPKEGTPYEIGCVALLKGAKQTEAGRHFLDWTVSMKAQNEMHRWGRYPILPQAKTPKGLGGPGEIKLVPMDSKLGLERERLLARWRQRMGK